MRSGDDVIRVASILTTTDTPGDFVVDSPTGATGPYTLQRYHVCGASPTCPGDDMFEGAVKVGGATPLNRTTTHARATSCGGDDDAWFVFVPATCTVTATLHAAVDLDLALYRWLGADVYDTSWTAGTGEESVAYTTTATGYVEVAVTAAAGAEGPYTLDTEVACP